MVFASAIFLLLYFPTVLCIYFVIDNKYRNFWLFISSFIFYSWGGLQYALLILFSTIINYFFGLYIGKEHCKQPKLALALSVIFNLGILGFFKYFNFSVDIINHFINLVYIDYRINAPIIPLPIGISFYTFQIMSYVIDIYRKKVKPQNNFINLGLYIMLFPHVLAGPIVRYSDIEQEISNRSISIENIRIGLRRFILGLSKKVFLANTAANFADYAFSVTYLNTPLAWLGILAYSLQIFFDFSAYSDMAIGMGRIFGFHFLENFNYPYISSSIQDFWRRWHISLSSWFRDYLYIPLGGNRKGIVRTYINNIIVFFCTGLWHGAALNFVVWGLYHGLFLILERIGAGRVLHKVPKVFSHIYTLIIIMVGWVFFRANTLNDSVLYIKKMFILDFNHMEYLYLNLNSFMIIMLLLGILFSTPIIPFVKDKMKVYVTQIKTNIVYMIISDFLYIILFSVSILFVIGSKFNPFIYFRF